MLECVSRVHLASSGIGEGVGVVRGLGTRMGVQLVSVCGRLGSGTFLTSSSDGIRSSDDARSQSPHRTSALLVYSSGLPHI